MALLGYIWLRSILLSWVGSVRLGLSQPTWLDSARLRSNCTKNTWLEKTQLGVTSRPHGSRKLGSGSLRGHLARENSARGCFEATWLENARLGFFRGHLTRLACLGSAWLDSALPNCSTGSAQSGSACLEKTRLGATPKSLGSRISSRSLRSHLARENSVRVHFDATWLEKTRLRVTSRPHDSRKLGSGSLRGHLAREDSAVGCFEATWLEKARLGFFEAT